MKRKASKQSKLSNKVNVTNIIKIGDNTKHRRGRRSGAAKKHPTSGVSAIIVNVPPSIPSFAYPHHPFHESPPVNNLPAAIKNPTIDLIEDIRTDKINATTRSNLNNEPVFIIRKKNEAKSLSLSDSSSPSSFVMPAVKEKSLSSPSSFVMPVAREKSIVPLPDTPLRSVQAYITPTQNPMHQMHSDVSEPQSMPSRVGKVQSYLTGRWIKIGGAAYKKLQ